MVYFQMRFTSLFKKKNNDDKICLIQNLINMNTIIISQEIKI